jgi:transcriptional regulator with XRE-family HTH domain
MALSKRPPASPVSLALADEIRRLRERGLSVREIGRRTGISKSQVHNISIGKRGISTARAITAAERLSRERPALVLTEGGLRAVDPVSRRERQKIGRYMRAIQDAKDAADFRAIHHRFRHTVIKTREGDFRLETDPEVLRDLDDAGLLHIEEVFHYEPKARAA